MKPLKWNTEGKAEKFSKKLGKSSATWFYLIAGFSVLSTLIFYFSGNQAFLIGLGISNLIESIIGQIDFGHGLTVLKLGACGLELVIAAIFVFFGLAAGKGRKWAIVVGTVIYLLDGLLLFVLGEYYATGFHASIIFILLKTYWTNTNAAAPTRNSRK